MPIRSDGGIGVGDAQFGGEAWHTWGKDTSGGRRIFNGEGGQNIEFLDEAKQDMNLLVMGTWRHQSYYLELGNGIASSLEKKEKLVRPSGTRILLP